MEMFLISDMITHLKQTYMLTHFHHDNILVHARVIWLYFNSLVSKALFTTFDQKHYLKLFSPTGFISPWKQVQNKNVDSGADDLAY